MPPACADQNDRLVFLGEQSGILLYLKIQVLMTPADFVPLQSAKPL